MAFAAPPAAAEDVQIIEQSQISPRLVELTISTPAFAEPTKVDVVLPTGYDADTAKRWPVTYFLAGTMNNYRTFTGFAQGLRLSESYPSIIVSPNGDSGYWSDWYNGGAFGPPMYETYVIEQLIPLIDANFRTIAQRSQRAVMGTSMGGYGAMMVAAHHPDLFVAAATLSGAVDSNLPAHGAVLSISPTFQGADADAIYGPRATQEVRWHGHNPTDLAGNLRGLDLQLRSANGVPNPAIGENPASADTVSCIIEGGVYMASVSMRAELNRLGIGHLWHDYGAGCHTRPNFQRQIVDTFGVFTGVFADPPSPSPTFDYAAIAPAFDIWGWDVVTDPGRALEFLTMRAVGPGGLTVAGSGLASVTTPGLFRGADRVALDGAVEESAEPDGAGRIRFTVDLGPPNPQQQYSAGAVTAVRSRTVSFRPVQAGGCRGAITGDGRPNRLYGTLRGERIFGLAGADHITGWAGDDCIWGQRGNDRLSGGPGDDVISGSAGADLIKAGKGRDRVGGGLGADRINVRDGERDVVRCGPGGDVVIADSRDRLTGCERVRRSARR